MAASPIAKLFTPNPNIPQYSNQAGAYATARNTGAPSALAVASNTGAAPVTTGPVLPHGNVAGVPSSKSALGGTTIGAALSPGNLSKVAGMATQKTLAKLGYNLTIDGVIGPQTQSALDAHSKGISAAAWNASQAGHVQPPAKLPPTTSVVKTTGTPPASLVGTPPAAVTGQGGTTGTGGANNTSGSDPATLTGVIQAINAMVPGSDSGEIAALAKGLISPQQAMAMAQQNAAKIAQIGSGLTNNQENAGAVANASAGAQYNPAISGLKAQVGNSLQQAKTDQGDISGWYQTLVNNMNQRNAQVNQTGQNEVSQIQATAPGTAAALGFSPGTAGGDNIDAGGAIQTAAARMANQSQSAFDSNAVGIVGAQGRADQTNQLNIDRNKTTDLQNQLIAQQQAKGQDVTALTAAGKQQNWQNNNDFINSKLGIQNQVNTAKQAGVTNADSAINSQISAKNMESAADMQHYQAVAAGANSLIAARTADTQNAYVASQTAKNTATAAAIPQTTAAIVAKDNAQAKAALVTANARQISANNGSITAAAANLRAKTAFTTAYNNTLKLGSQVFPGATGLNTGKIGTGIATGISGNSTYFKDGKLVASPQALASAVNQQMEVAGADMSTAAAQRYAINVMSMLGQKINTTQAKQWFNFGSGKVKAKK